MVFLGKKEKAVYICCRSGKGIGVFRVDSLKCWDCMNTNCKNSDNSLV